MEEEGVTKLVQEAIEKLKKEMGVEMEKLNPRTVGGLSRTRSAGGG